MRQDIIKIITGFIPSFIHFIDGGIMRMIILEVYKSDRYIINHLHDSIQFHPNYFKSIINSIENTYTNPILTSITIKGRNGEKIITRV